MNELSAVIFDMDGTLVEWQDPGQTFEQVALTQFADVYRALIERGLAWQGHRPPQAQDFSASLYAKAGAEWRRAMQARQSYTVYDLFREGLPEMGLEVTEEDLAISVQTFEARPSPTGPKEDALAVLTTLRDRGLKLGLISNSWSTPGCRDDELRRGGLLDLLEVRVHSSEMAVMKPHPAIFARALDELGVTAAQAVMVGDMLEMDIGGAQAVGMRGVWIDNRGQGLPESTAIQPDARIRRLEELVKVLDSWIES
jgi:putative hydrolase of the HAD superfamily